MEFFLFLLFFSSGVTFGISNCVITITLPFSRCCLFCFLSSGVSYIMFVHPSIHPSIHIHQILMGERVHEIWIGIGIRHTSGFPSSCII
ncbi:uncharacterized protein BO96DRAFT_239935 [Aspergillus niger CBS 101883]|uniref:Secreted protein n=1 Tax=Aspergillus niger ATCC 13496 TaxID=1353008 RepID=A0A370C4G4_ASPNG|nr:uncharacterized protein BO96DRAFT_239935 [Aspergillus niger CBS 101883]PYH58399.1 hypothetical protein BO96DRAFT_239935 [Aspergillus niger CBS 101883]RDH22767.1 hypothetical protein M747DRAFT_171863 [Aspergillus niger ATCC 13496]